MTSPTDDQLWEEKKGNAEKKSVSFGDDHRVFSIGCLALDWNSKELYVNETEVLSKKKRWQKYEQSIR